MAWDKLVNVLKEHGLTNGEWAVLVALGYALYFPKEKFIRWAYLESRGDASIEEVSDAYDQCLTRGWMQTVPKGHLEQDKNVFGDSIGEPQECMEGSTVFTDGGFILWAQLSIALFGEEYFRRVDIREEE